MQPCHTIEIHRASPPSLAWWRDLSARAFTSAHEPMLKRDLAHMFGADLCASRLDDAAIAIGRAIRALRDKSASTESIDAAMSLTLLHALRGDAAAREIVIFGLRRQKSAACDLIADSWCVAPALQKTCASPSPRRRRPRIVQWRRHSRRTPPACRR